MAARDPAKVANGLAVSSRNCHAAIGVKWLALLHCARSHRGRCRSGRSLGSGAPWTARGLALRDFADIQPITCLLTKADAAARRVATRSNWAYSGAAAPPRPAGLSGASSRLCALAEHSADLQTTDTGRPASCCGWSTAEGSDETQRLACRPGRAAWPGAGVRYFQLPISRDLGARRMRLRRLDFPGARHHVMNRGARREDAFVAATIA